MVLGSKVVHSPEQQQRCPGALERAVRVLSRGSLWLQHGQKRKAGVKQHPDFNSGKENANEDLEIQLQPRKPQTGCLTTAASLPEAVTNSSP